VLVQHIRMISEGLSCNRGTDNRNAGNGCLLNRASRWQARWQT